MNMKGTSTGEKETEIHHPNTGACCAGEVKMSESDTPDQGKNAVTECI